MMIITLLVVIFALQNSMVIHLKIWLWSVDIHAGLILIITFAVGTFLGILSSVPRMMKRKREIKDLREQLSAKPDQNEPSDMDELPDMDEPPERDRSADPEFEDVISD